MSCIPSGPSLNPADVYSATMARRGQDKQRIEGQAAVKLIDSAQVKAPDAKLPPDATISVHA